MLVPSALPSLLFWPTPEAPHSNTVFRPVCDLAHAPAPRGSFFSSHVPFSCFAAVSFSSRRGAALMPHSRFIHPMTLRGIPRPITPPTRQESSKSSLTFLRPLLMLFRLFFTAFSTLCRARSKKNSIEANARYLRNPHPLGYGRRAWVGLDFSIRITGYFHFICHLCLCKSSHLASLFY